MALELGGSDTGAASGRGINTGAGKTMCGIAGIVSRGDERINADELHAMCAAMVRRGPDDEGQYLGDGAGLAMRRLSIIDLETGHQPVSNEDGSLWVVLNGEIYNYRQLRSQLEQRGHVFSTSTDTEVIVHLYEERGDDCVDELRGMFGFALWDERRRRLLLARDRLGIKPLYYGQAAGRFLFASELKAVLQIDDVERHVNWPSLAHLLAYGTTPAEDSIIEGIHKLEPGHRLVLEPGREPVVERYWDIRFTPNTSRSEQDTVTELRARLQEAVRYHQVSDVPVGAFLSGGIDSSAVVAMMARTTTNRIKTFSIGWREAEYNELPYARLVAERFGTDHHELVLDPDVMDLMDHLAWDLDEPFGDASAIPTYMVSKLAGQHVKVVLSGDGGDELFGGYDKYVVESRERMTRFLPSFVRGLMGHASRRWPEGVRGKNSLRHFSLPGPERYLDACTLLTQEDQAQLLTQAVRQKLGSSSPAAAPLERLARSGDHWLSTLQDLDLRRYLPLDILTKVDRMSMAHSLESRVPLLDHPLVEFAATIPADWKLRGTRTKYIFIQALRGLLPDAVLDRPKKGFGAPLGRWFRGALRPMVRELLLSDTFRSRGFFNQAFVAQLLKQHDAGRPLDQQLWTLMSIELWCRTFLDRKGVEARTPVGATRVSPARFNGRRTTGAKPVTAPVTLRERADHPGGASGGRGLAPAVGLFHAGHAQLVDQAPGRDVRRRRAGCVHVPRRHRRPYRALRGRCPAPHGRSRDSSGSRPDRWRLDRRNLGWTGCHPCRDRRDGDVRATAPSGGRSRPDITSGEPPHRRVPQPRCPASRWRAGRRQRAIRVPGRRGAARSRPGCLPLARLDRADASPLPGSRHDGVGDLGMMERPAAALEKPSDRYMSNPHVSGKRGGHTLNLHRFAAGGMTLLGHLGGIDGERVTLAPDVHQRIGMTDAVAVEISNVIDGFIARAGIDAPVSAPDNTDEYEGTEGIRQPVLESMICATGGSRLSSGLAASRSTSRGSMPRPSTAMASRSPTAASASSPGLRSWGSRSCRGSARRCCRVSGTTPSTSSRRSPRSRRSPDDARRAGPARTRRSRPRPRVRPRPISGLRPPPGGGPDALGGAVGLLADDARR